MIHARYRNEAFSARNKRVMGFFSPPNTADLTDISLYNLYKKYENIFCICIFMLERVPMIIIH